MAGVPLPARYTLLHRLASGGMADVFLARQQAPKGPARVVVVKRVLKEFADEPQFLQMFLDEARLAALISHPNVVSVNDLAESPEGYLLAMEYVAGRNLMQVAERATELGRQLTAEVAARLVADASVGLDFAHRLRDPNGTPLRIVHRDVCPQNILLSYAGKVKVADFGIAKAAMFEGRTKAGQLKGRLGYMAPERVSDGLVDRRSDVWSLGILLYWLLSGERPFSAESDGELVYKILHDDPPPIQRRGTPVPDDLEDICRLALRRDLDRRLQSAGELQLMLERWLGKNGEAVTQGLLAKLMDQLFPASTDGERVLMRRLVQGEPEPSPGELEEPTDESTEEEELPRGARPQSSSAGASPERAPAPGGAAHNLPAETNAFVGREQDLNDLGRLFAKGERLVTLVGTGGLGKTRLAVHFAAAQASSFAGGAWFVDLAEARSLEGVGSAIAAALGLSRLDEAEDPIVLLGQLLRQRRRLLLVLDSFEGAAEYAEASLGRLLQECSELCCLVTSRVTLEVSGERLYALPSLTLPPAEGGPGSEQAEALQLFLLRAQAARPGVTLGPTAWAAAIEIVRHLDGVPLAIELAAARMTTGSPESLLPRLAQRFELLAAKPRTDDRTQVAMRGAIDWAWDLLLADERTALAQCALFRGGFSLAAAQQVVRFDSDPSPALATALAALEQKSFLRKSAAVGGEPRYRMPVRIQEAAEAHLGETPAEQEAQARHASYFLSEGAAEAAESVWEPSPWLALEHENLWAVHDRAAASTRGAEDQLAALLALDPLLMNRGPLRGYAELLEAALTRATEAGLAPFMCARALVFRARVERMCGELEKGLVSGQAGLARARELGDRALQGLAHSVVGYCHLDRWELELAREHLRAALQLHREIGDELREGGDLIDLAFVEQQRGMLDEARRIYSEAVTLASGVGSPGLEAEALGSYALLLQELGRKPEALTYLQRAVEIQRQLNNRWRVGWTLGYLALVHRELGELDRALAPIRESLAIAREVGRQRSELLGWICLAAVLAGLGSLEAAQEAFETAERLLRVRRDPLLGPVLTVERGQLDVARARLAMGAGHPVEAQTHLLAAKRRLNAAQLPGAKRTDDLRIVIRLLEQSMESLKV